VSYRWRCSIYTGLSLIVLALSSSSFLGAAIAATPPAESNNAIRVSPALSNIQLSAGETNTTIVAMVTNQTTSPLVVDITGRDFGAFTAKAGAISFYGKGYNPNTNPHGLQTALTFGSSKITLPAKTTQKVSISLDNVNKLAAGGHYGAVLFSPETLAASLSGTKISVQSAVASLIFLKTASGGTQTLKLLPFSESAVRFNLPNTGYVVLNDAGNSQTAPQGQLTLYGPSGAIISTSVINPGSGLILPGTSRLFTIPLPFGNMRFARPGIYRMELQYRDSSQQKFTVINRSFYYVNIVIFIPVVILFIGVIYFFRWRGKHLVHTSRRAAHHIRQRTKKTKHRPNRIKT
jgi:hypothetical protein